LRHHSPTHETTPTTVDMNRLLAAVSLLAIAAIGLSAGAEEGGMREMCKCHGVDECRTKIGEAFPQCLRECSSHVSDRGGEPDAYNQCYTSQHSKWDKAYACIRREFKSGCAEGEGPEKAPKRDFDTIKMAVFHDVTAMTKKWGVEDEVRELMVHAKAHYLCVTKCIRKKSDECAHADCGLRLPADAEVVAVGKRCAIEAGFNTEGVREVCECVAKAGIKGLDKICPKIKIE